MSSLRRIALVQSHQRLAPVQAYYLNDLVELCGLAAFVRDEVGQVDIPVSPSDRDPLATFERYMRRNRPDLVGISTFTCGANSGRDYARIAKRMGAFVIAGGFHPSACPEEVLGWCGVDAVVRGEGEYALRELIRSGSPRGIAGLSYRSGNDFVHHPVAPVIEDLDSLPLPTREIRPERFGLSGLNYHTDTIFGSRGCRGRCRFCANHLIGRGWRPRSNDSIMRELLTITPPRKGPWKYVKFWDSNFLADAQRVDELCRMILGEGLERWFRFVVETRVEDIIRAAPILASMRRAGFVRVGCGVESPNPKTQRGLGKGINLDHVGAAAKLIADNEMHFVKFLIIGHEHESRDDILAYPDYALSHGIRLQKTTVFVMTPYPGTDLAREVAEKHGVASLDWDLYTNFGAVVEPGGLGSLELQGLLFAVTAGIAMSAKFVAGKTLLRVAGRLLEPMFVAVRMARLNDRFPHDDVWMMLMDMVQHLPATTDCSRAIREKRRLGDRVAIRFHCAGRPSVVLGIIEEHGVERLVMRVGRERLSTRGRSLSEVHLSLPLTVHVLERVDHRRLAHDMAALRWNAWAFKLRWLPSFLWQVGVVKYGLLRLLAFHLRKVAGR